MREAELAAALKKAEDAYQMAFENKATLATHEAVCAERYNGISQKLDLINERSWKANCAIIALLVAIAAFFLAQKLV